MATTAQQMRPEREEIVRQNSSEFGGSMNQKEIAEQYDIPRSTLSNIIQGLRTKVQVTGVTPESLEEDAEATIEQLLKRQQRVKRLLELQKEQVVAIDSDRPVGVTLFSDIHWGNRDVDYEALVRDTELVRDCEGMYAFGLGDYTDNWIGKLGGIAAEQSVTIEQEKATCRWWFEQLTGKIPVVVAGNHDNRSITTAHIDYVHDMLRGAALLYGKDEVRFTLKLGKAEWVWKCRHSFRGGSQWNETHATEKDGKLYDLWDFAASGHYHHPTMIRPFYQQSRGTICYACNIGTYKMRDDFATMLGYRTHHSTYTATIIYTPDGEVIIPQGATLEQAAKYLSWLRKTY
jgi:transposase-like protein